MVEIPPELSAPQRPGFPVREPLDQRLSDGFECDVYGTPPHRVVGLQPSSGFSQRYSFDPRGHQGALQVIVTPIEPSRENRCEGFFCPEIAVTSH